MNIDMYLAGPSTWRHSAFGVCPGQGSEPVSGKRTRPDAVSTLDPHAASAPLGWSP